MEEGLVRSFARAAAEVLSEIGLEVARIGSVPGDSVEADARAATVATVGILGDARGSLLLRLDSRTASNIVEAMYRSFGLERSDADEEAETAIAELANQICGRAITLLGDENLECDITPPAIISGTQVSSSLPGIADIEYRSVEGAFGTLLIALGLKR